MPRFSAPEKQGAKQAGAVIRQLQGGVLKSVRTAGNYEDALSKVATGLAYQQRNLRDLTPQTARDYLELRAEQVGQSQLNMERQALQCMMRHVTSQLDHGARLPVVVSEYEQTLEARAYTPEQVQAIVERQAPQNALATEIAYAAGLRAHELYTLRPLDEQHPDIRPALADKFAYRGGERYTVVGKGNLCREVRLPRALAERLEARRLPAPQRVTDRRVHYERQYQIGGGRNFSQSFTRASKGALGFSNGAHGLRHSYAQERMDKLRDRRTERAHALETVSQELGHFRPDITETYLR